MSFDAIGALQRIQKMEQDQARHNGKLALKRINSTADTVIGVLWMLSVLFGWILFFIPTLIMTAIVLIKPLFTKYILVQNIASGEKMYLTKPDWKAYRIHNKSKIKVERIIL